MSEFTMEKYKSFSEYRDSKKYRAIWSIYGMGSFEDAHNLTADVMVYGGNAAFIFGNTYGDLYETANELIMRSNDNHHLFIEGFEMDNGQLNLITGS